MADDEESRKDVIDVGSNGVIGKDEKDEDDKDSDDWPVNGREDRVDEETR